MILISASIHPWIKKINYTGSGCQPDSRHSWCCGWSQWTEPNPWTWPSKFTGNILHISSSEKLFHHCFISMYHLFLVISCNIWYTNFMHWFHKKKKKYSILFILYEEKIVLACLYNSYFAWFITVTEQESNFKTKKHVKPYTVGCSDMNLLRVLYIYGKAELFSYTQLIIYGSCITYLLII